MGRGNGRRQSEKRRGRLVVRGERPYRRAYTVLRRSVTGWMENRVNKQKMSLSDFGSGKIKWERCGMTRGATTVSERRR